MDILRVAKKIMVIALIIIFIVNIFFYIKNKEMKNDFKEIQQTNTQLKEDNKLLNEKMSRLSNTKREKYYEKLTNVASDFIETAYVQKLEGYQKRRKKAKKIMDNKLFNRFYPSDNFEQKEIETNVKSDKYYIEKYNKGANKVDVLVELKHQQNYKQIGAIDLTDIFMRITLERKKDTWKAKDIEYIYYETKKQKKEIKDERE